MKVLLDQGAPAPLRRVLRGHTVSTAYEMGWDRLDNGALLMAVEAEFDVFVTPDKNIRYQQKLGGSRLAILVLPTTNWHELRARADKISELIDALRPGDFVEFES